MKKFLSLALALVMCLSLVTISAGAKDFTDDSKITYSEAVDVVSAVGIVDGYEDGSFNPSATLTRGAAAKIITNMILGPTTAGALTADAAPFKDVPANHTFAGQIAYCASQGIINGYADKSFRPAGTVTGYQFMKMLLGALGYDGKIEGYTGDNWSVNVAKRAGNVGLIDGNDSFVGTAAMTREEACLYAFNALNATMVEYENKGSSIIIGGVEYSQGASAAKDVENKANVETIKNDDKMQFAEQYFDNLKKSETTDDFGRPATQWKLKTEEIGKYAEKADASYTKDVKLGDIYADLGLSTRTVPAIVKNGADTNNTSLVLFKGNSTKIGTGNGVLTEAYVNDDDSVTLVEIETYVGQVSRSVAATSSKDAYIVINTTSVKPVSSGSVNFETNEAFEDDAYVLYTYANGEVQTVAVAESVTGEVTTYTADKNITVAGTKYDYSKNVAGTTAPSTKNDYDVYLDAYGYAIYVDEQEFVSSDFAYVINAENASDDAMGSSNRARLVFTDGAVRTVNTSKGYESLKGDIVTYKVNDNNEYVLRGVTTTDIDKAASFVLTKGTAAITATGISGLYANSNTVFMVKTLDSSDEAVYKAYTGIANVPSITNADGETVTAAYYAKNGTMVNVMFIDATTAKVSTSSKDVTFLAGKSVSGKIIDADNNQFYSYNAVVNGEITTVMVDATVDVTGKMTDGKLDSGVTNALFSNVSTDDDNIITSLTAYATTGNPMTASTTGTVKLSGDSTLGFGTSSKTYYTVANDCKVFFIDGDGVITSGSASSIGTDENDVAYYVIDDGELTYIFIQAVDEGANDPGGSSDTYTAKLTNAGGTLTLTVTSSSDTSVKVTGTITVSNLTGGNSATIDITEGSVVKNTDYTYTLASSSIQTYKATVTVGGETLTTNTVIGG